jgi:hypothetical protein
MITIKLFKDINRPPAGAQTTIDSNVGQTYLARNKSFLENRGLNDEISSCEVTMSSDETGTALLYLFEEADFSGRYVAIRISPGTPQRINNFADIRGVGINDKVSSFILFRRTSNDLPFPFNTQRLDGETGYLKRLATEFDPDDKIKSISRRGEPTIQWDCFGEMAPSEQVLRLRLPLKVNPSAQILRERDLTYHFWLKPIFMRGGAIRMDLLGFKVDADAGLVPAGVLERMAKKLLDEMNMEQEFSNALDEMLGGIAIPGGRKIVDYYLLHFDGQSQLNFPSFSSSTTENSRCHVVFQVN